LGNSKVMMMTVGSGGGFDLDGGLVLRGDEKGEGAIILAIIVRNAGRAALCWKILRGMCPRSAFRLRRKVTSLMRSSRLSIAFSTSITLAGVSSEMGSVLKVLTIKTANSNWILRYFGVSAVKLQGSFVGEDRLLAEL